MSLEPVCDQRSRLVVDPDGLLQQRHRLEQLRIARFWRWTAQKSAIRSNDRSRLCVIEATADDVAAGAPDLTRR